MEQVPAFTTHDAGRSLAAWTHIWNRSGFQVHSERFEAHDLLPVTRARLMLWAWRPWCAGLAHRLALAVRDSRAVIPNRCPSERGYLWLGSVDPCLRLDLAMLGMYQHPDLRPWRGYERAVCRGKVVGVIMRT